MKLVGQQGELTHPTVDCWALQKEFKFSLQKSFPSVSQDFHMVHH